jgi:hypothetical protein
LRQQLFWEAWIAAIADAGADAAVPGEVDAGLGRFLRSLTDGPSAVEILPGREQDGDERGARFLPESEMVAAVLGRLVPFPTAAEPGGRTRVRLLDGVGDPALVLEASPRLVPAGAEIVIFGNSAEGFDIDRTSIRVHDVNLVGAAERLRDALGVGDVRVEPRPTDTYDVTIVLGADARP